MRDVVGSSCEPCDGSNCGTAALFDSRRFQRTKMVVTEMLPSEDATCAKQGRRADLTGYRRGRAGCPAIKSLREELRQSPDPERSAQPRSASASAIVWCRLSCRHSTRAGVARRGRNVSVPSSLSTAVIGHGLNRSSLWTMLGRSRPNCAFTNVNVAVCIQDNLPFPKRKHGLAQGAGT